VSRAALELVHVDPDTGDDTEGACVRGCYRCLLSYGNQTVHEKIDRRRVIPLLQALAASTTRADASSVVTDSPKADPTSSAADRTPSTLEQWLRAADLRLPTDVDAEREGVRVDLAFDQTTPPAAILYGHVDPTATTDLVFAGWNVITVDPADDPWDVILRNPAVFGTAASKPVLPSVLEGDSR
jgi:hypothetical protein